MPIKPGDHVRFLHEKQEGTVLRLLPKGRAEVLVDDFLEIEVALDEIVSVHASEEVLRKPGTQPSTSELPLEIRKSSGFPELLASKDEEGDTGMWFSNQSETDWLFVFYVKVGGRYRNLNAGLVHRGDKIFIGKLSGAELHNTKILIYQGIPVSPGESGKPAEPIRLEIPFRFTIFNSPVTELPEIKRQGHRICLLPGHEMPPPQENKLKEPIVIVNAPKEVVDLHIEELEEDYMDLDALAMLEIQIREFDKRLSDAHFHGLRKITFIHGVGRGTLRGEIHLRLGKCPFVKTWNAADPATFGNGATEVILTD